MAVVQGELRVTRHGDGRVEIVQAPPVALVTLELLAAVDPVVVRVSGREIRFADQVTYRVAGWDDVQACLVLHRVEGF